MIQQPKSSCDINRTLYHKCDSYSNMQRDISIDLMCLDVGDGYLVDVLV